MIMQTFGEHVKNQLYVLRNVMKEPRRGRLSMERQLNEYTNSISWPIGGYFQSVL